MSTFRLTAQHLYHKLDPDKQLRIATEIMCQANTNAWALEKKFKNPERLANYYRSIKIPVKTLILNHNLNLNILDDQPQTIF